MRAGFSECIEHTKSYGGGGSGCGCAVLVIRGTNKYKQLQLGTK